MAMVQNYVKHALKIVVAQVCYNMGWNSIQTTPLDLLVDILHRYLEELGRTAHRYSEQFGRTEPNLDDLGLAFKDIGIALGELEDYVNNVEPVPFVQDIAKIPVPRANHFQFPKQGSREVVTRPEFIDEHLPLTNPEAEDEESPSTSGDGFTRKNGIETTELNGHGLKRPLDVIGTNGVPFKRPRLYADDEGCPMREGISVSMTVTGEIAGEGRGPEARAPKFYDEIRSSSSSHSPEPSAIEVSDSWKDTKKELKTDKVKMKNRKDKNKLLKKKTGKKEKVKNSSKKNKDKSKDGKKVKILPDLTSTIERGPDGKFKKSKSSKSKSLTNKKKTGEEKPKVKKKLLIPVTATIPISRLQKSPKTIKTSTLKPPRGADKHQSPLAQLASFLSKSKDQQDDDSSSPEVVPTTIKSEASQGFSGEDSPERLIIDDNPDVTEKHERESRLAALNDSIDAVIMKGLEESEKEREQSSRLYHETIEDVIRQGVETTVKTEPRDVYDFTDDDLSPPATPDGAAPPPKKKQRRDSAEMGKKVRDKIKEKIKLKSKEPKPKVKSPFGKIKIDEGEFHESKMPEIPPPPPLHALPSLLPEEENGVSFQTPYSQMLRLPYFGQIPQVPPALLPYPPRSIAPLPLPFQSHIPPNMPMPPMGFYVRNSRPESGNLRFNEPVINSPILSPQPSPTPTDVKRSEVFAQPKIENVEEPDKSKGNKKEKVKEGDEEDGEKSKVKKKKEKVKDKKKGSDVGEKSQAKISKGNKEKVPKSKDKKKPDKKKKEDKVKEDASVIPRITLKLGGNAAQSEGTKIVIKPMAPRESIQSSDSSSPTTDIVSSTPKSHPKPQSKVNPVPLPANKPPVVSSTPARTVITETVGTIIDAQGNKIWICPACTRPDDGSPMIGCDECDDWYHWVCVGIVVPPKEEENWFCSRCIVKKQGLQKKKKKKHRKDKMDV